MTISFKAHILSTKDEEFTLNLLRDVPTGTKFQVEAVTYVAGAIAKIGSFDPMQLLQI
jgi:hypothetical protein